jgi:hypothetical protein
MAEAKPFASLSSGLLARKGAAKPAMRPQGFGSFGGSLEDLGWNDMGHPPAEHVPTPIDALTPIRGPHRYHEEEEEAPEPVVLEQQRALEESFAQEPEAEPEPESLAVQAEPEADEAEPEPTALEPEPEVEPVAVEAAPEPAAVEAAPEPAAVEPEPAAVEPEPEPVHAADPAPVVSIAPRRSAPPLPAKGKAAFTLRLDPERHLQLRLACAVTRRSAQQLVTGALDDFLNSLPEVQALAQRVPAEAGRRGR